MDEKKCENCKNFILYYFNHKGLYKPLRFGHCICEKVYSNRTKRIYCNEVCNFWEGNEEVKLKQQESIERTLHNMAKDLNHIAQILKEDKL